MAAVDGRLTLRPSECIVLIAGRFQERRHMRRVLTATWVVAVAAVGVTAAFPCGDKLMLFARGARFGQVYPRSRAASILAYTHQNSSVPAVVRVLELQPALKQAGHQLKVVGDPAALEAALRTGNYDLVLADVADAESLEQQIRSAPSTPVMLAVAYDRSKAEETAAAKKFRFLLKAPTSVDRYLAAIDKVMEQKLKGSARNSPR